jgi:hypothetical protein
MSSGGELMEIAESGVSWLVVIEMGYNNVNRNVVGI